MVLGTVQMVSSSNVGRNTIMRTIGNVAERVIDPPETAQVGPAYGLRSWGWPVSVIGTSLVLETTSGFCGVEMPQVLGDAVLRRLRSAGVEGPVVRVPRPDPWLVFLAEADGVVENNEVFARSRARLVQGANSIPLPPTVTSMGRTSWAIAPDVSHRWLPELSTVVWAITSVSSMR
jgi:hypothetical protein